MRMLLLDLTQEDLCLIKKAKDFGQNTWMVTQDIYEDIVACLTLGPEVMHIHLVSFDSLYEEAASQFVNIKGIRFSEIMEKLFECRRDLVAFADGDLLRDLYCDTVLTHEQKVELLLEGMVNILENMFNLSQDSLSGKGLEGTPYRMFGDILGSLAPPSRTRNGSTHLSGRGSSFNDPDLKKTEANKLYKNLMELMSSLCSKKRQELFKLSQKFNLSLKGKEGCIYRDVFIGNSVRFRKMRSLNEIRNISAADWALPEQAFDAKLAKKNFMIRQPTDKYEKSQLIYVLADKSGSMNEGVRELFVKALMLSLGKNCIIREGKLYSRWFNDSVTELKTLEKRSDWYAYVNDTVCKKMSGMTNLHRALHVAAEDIADNAEVFDETEIILVTDGTVDVNAEEIRRRIPYPIHVVLLAKPSKELLNSYRKTFDTVIVTQAVSIEDALNGGMQLIKVA